MLPVTRAPSTPRSSCSCRAATTSTTASTAGISTRISDTDLSRFPKPDDVGAADWPPIDALRTWLYGIATIAPRVTSTDLLTGGYEYPLVPYPGPPPHVTVLTTGGWCVGPNGRVP